MKQLNKVLYVCIGLIMGSFLQVNVCMSASFPGLVHDTTEEKQAFELFLSYFPQKQLPLSLPEDSDQKYFRNSNNLPQVPEDLADRYLSVHSGKFRNESADAKHPIRRYFNFPEFENVPYYAYARLAAYNNLIPIIFCVDNNQSLYFGMALFTSEGRFLDQVFVAGQEGGSGVAYILKAEIAKGLKIQLKFEHLGKQSDRDYELKVIHTVKETVIPDSLGYFHTIEFFSEEMDET